jgi:O-antigen ligase
MALCLTPGERSAARAERREVRSRSRALMTDRFTAACALLLLAAPWLNPFAPGPSSAVGPLLFAWLCGAFAIGLGVWRDPRIVAWGWLAAALASAVFGLVQYFGWAAWAGGAINHTEPGIAFGNLRQRNQFATLLSIGMGAVLYLAPVAGRPRLAAAAMALLALASAAAASRTGAVQLALLLALAIAWPGPERALRLALSLWALALYLPATFALPPLLELLTGHTAPGLVDRVSGGPACSSRLVLWANVLELVRERPWLGWGIGELDYAHYAHLYGGLRFCDILDNAHNLPLHVAVELGVPAAVALLGAIAWFVARARPWRERDPARRLAWTVIAFIAVHSLLEYPLWYGPFQLALLLSVLVIVKGDGAPARRFFAPALTFAAIPLLVAYTAWDYHRISQLYLAPEDRAARYRQNTRDQAAASVLFAPHVRFAELSVTPLTRDNALQVQPLALQMLHFSPEPKVIEAVIGSAMVLKDEDTARWHMLRYQAAFPQDYIEWLGRYTEPAKP